MGENKRLCSFGRLASGVERDNDVECFFFLQISHDLNGLCLRQLFDDTAVFSYLKFKGILQN
jgi:hypothetical protein